VGASHCHDDDAWCDGRTRKRRFGCGAWRLL